MDSKPLAATARRRQTLAATVASVVWARRWKVASVLAVYALGRACEYAPAWLQTGCEVLSQVLRVLP